MTTPSTVGMCYTLSVFPSSKRFSNRKDGKLMDAETFLLSVVGIALACFTILVIAVLWYSYKEEKLKRTPPSP